MLDDCNILIVEDEFFIGLDLSLALEDHGADVTGPFATVDTALPACGPEVDAAILDVDIHGGKSFPIADRLSERGVPFLFHTGRADLDILTTRYGDDVPILVKPTQPRHVAVAISRLLHADLND